MMQEAGIVYPRYSGHGRNILRKIFDVKKFYYLRTPPFLPPFLPFLRRDNVRFSCLYFRFHQSSPFVLLPERKARSATNQPQWIAVGCICLVMHACLLGWQLYGNLAVWLNTIPQIQINKVLVRYSRFFWHLFKVFNDIDAHTNGYLFLQPFYIGILAPFHFWKIVFFSHRFSL